MRLLRFVARWRSAQRNSDRVPYPTIDVDLTRTRVDDMLRDRIEHRCPRIDITRIAYTTLKKGTATVPSVPFADGWAAGEGKAKVVYRALKARNVVMQ